MLIFALKMILGTAVFFVLLFVLLQNAAELVNIHFFALKFTNVKLFWVLFASFAAGAVVMAVFSGSLAGSAHARDNKLVRLKLLTEPSGRQMIMVDPPHAKIWRDTPDKPKTVNWSTVNHSPYDELFWELRYRPSKGGDSENYFGDVDIGCGKTGIEVQPDKTPDNPNAEWRYSVTVFACVDGAKGQKVRTVNARVVWKD